MEDDQLAAVFDVAASRTDVTVGYVPDLAEVAAPNGLVESAEGSVLLRELGEHQAHIGLPTIALDLYELGDTREFAAAARWIAGRLNQRAHASDRRRLSAIAANVAAESLKVEGAIGAHDE